MVASHGWYADITTNEQSKKGQKVEQIDYHHKSYQVIVLRLLIGLIANGSKKERHFFPPFRIPFNKYLYLCACIAPATRVVATTVRRERMPCNHLLASRVVSTI